MSKTITVDRNLLVDLIKKTTDGHIKYKMGAKCNGSIWSFDLHDAGSNPAETTKLS